MDSLRRLYLDYNATSPLSISVQDWLKSGDLVFANPSSQHSQGKASRKLINKSRSEIFETFGMKESNTSLFFHSGATEGINSWAYSFSEWARKEKRKLLICYSKIDHPAVVSLTNRYFGDHVDFFEIQHGSHLEVLHQENITQLKAFKKQNPDLLILYHHLWVHNETGFVTDPEELVQLKEIPDLYIHVDAVQVPGKIPEWRTLGEGDIWTFSGHKFGALKGIGFSFFNKKLVLNPLITGGGQQQGLRAGTENPQGVYSIALALKDLIQIDVNENLQRRKSLEKFLSNELQGLGEIVQGKKSNSNTIYFYLYKHSSDIALALFDLHGLEMSAGSACSSGTAKPSAVLTQLGKLAVAANGLRLSFGFQLSEEDLNMIKDRFVHVFNKLRSHT